jgi:hypothetical protein
MALKEFKINSIAELLKRLPTVCEPERTVWYRGMPTIRGTSSLR